MLPSECLSVCHSAVDLGGQWAAWNLQKRIYSLKKKNRVARVINSLYIDKRFD